METTKTEFIFTGRSSKKQKFDKRLIEHIVRLVEQGVPRKDLMQEYGMSSGTLIDWINRHGAGASKKSYTLSEKRSVVRAVAGGMSIKQAQIAFNISYPSVIRSWIKKFEEENAEISLTNPVEMAKKKTDTSENLELQALQKALEEANLRIRALDTMISK
jgi:transposase